MIERQSMDVDIVCVGFGPATGGFLTTLARGFADSDTPPPMVICYERADDIGYGVSGVVTRARGIRASFPELNPAEIPMAAEVRQEKVLYLLDPIGASRRSLALRAADAALRALRFALPVQDHALELPFTPEFLHKQGGLLLSIGQFNQWVGQQLMATGTVQIWPGTPVTEAIVEGRRVAGVRLADQGTDRQGNPEAGFLPGMDIRAQLTVVGDGPFGAVGRQLNQRFGMPEGHSQREWAVGMKMVIDLPEGCALEAGTVLHTFGYPEPEIFGFLYVHPDRVASVGIFVPSWMDSPVRTSYRYLQHYIRHPCLWRHLKGGALRSWGAKSLQESGRRGEPLLAGDGFARIGEGSGSTNVLTGSGVDEAWTTGVELGEAVLELLREGKPFSKENLEATYVRRRRASWVETEGRVAERARDGFHHGVVTGLIGMGMAGLTGGRLWMPGEHVPHYERIPTVFEYYKSKIPAEEIARIREECAARGASVHDALMERSGWPAIEYDGRLLVTQQDALLMGGKVQAPAGYADHVVFLYPSLCESCGTQVCVEVCSGQAIAPGPEGVPVFDREKCVHCGACLWNCSQPLEEDPERTNIDFRAGAGGLHSGEN
ncbi:MAG: 4Fe-4S ferredoxin [Acidobacteria bacterium]|nr:4Fe-4S ferredoxin [Acidobacteriota bacterium]